MVFAHEFGHAVQQRLGLFNQQVPTIVHESQADCAAGAFTAYAHEEPGAAHPGHADRPRPRTRRLPERPRRHAGPTRRRSRTATASTESARWPTASQSGVTDCYKSDWSDSHSSPSARSSPGSKRRADSPGGNEPFAEVIDPGPTATGGGGLQPDLNRFWKAAAQVGQQVVHQTSRSPRPPTRRAATPAASSATARTTTPSTTARRSRSRPTTACPALNIDRRTGNVSVVENQPGDFALGTLFVVRLGPSPFATSCSTGRSTTRPRCSRASCYTGAYAKNINVDRRHAGHDFTPVAARHGRGDVGDARAWSAPTRRSARAARPDLERVQAFIKGYNGSGLGSADRLAPRRAARRSRARPARSTS